MLRISFRSAWITTLGIIILLTTGCASISKPEQPYHSLFQSINSDISIGQTALARYDGLESISLFIAPENSGNGEIQLSIHDSPTKRQTLARATISNKTITQPGNYTITFAPILHTTMKDLYVLLEYVGEGSLRVAIAPGNFYLNGSLYVDQIPQDAQMAFSFGYQSTRAIFGLLNESLVWLLWLAVAFFLFVLPGWVLLAITWPGWNNFDWTVKLGLSAGISLPIYPLIMVWTSLFGVNLGSLYTWIPPCAAIVVMLWIHYTNKKKVPETKHLTQRISPFQIEHFDWSKLAYVIVLGIIILTRLWEIRSLDIPMWGDSYQHTVITQLLIDNQGLFNSWQPYTEATTFSYHFGFHSLAAVFHWATNLTAPKAVMVTGQLLNILAAISLVPMAILIGKNRWSGVITMLLAGLLFQMPNFYLNWGRYPQLTGQIILASLIWLFYNWAANHKRFRFAYIPLCIIFAGLAMTHYRVIIMAALFLAAYWLLYVNRTNITRLFQKTAFLSLGAFLLFLPWFTRAFFSYLIRWLQNKLRTQAHQSLATSLQVQDLGSLNVYIPALFWLVFLVCIAWGLWKQKKSGALISLWWLLIIIVANPHWLNLPGKGILDTFAVLIAVYFPAAIIIGAAIGWIIDEINHHIKNRLSVQIYPRLAVITRIVFGFSIIIVGILGGRSRLWDIQYPVFSLVTRPDLNAANWIKENTPQDATFLVNSLFAYNNSVIVGTDAGWWLPIIARRKTSLPPLTYGIEKGPNDQYRSWINYLSAEIEEKGIIHPDVLQEIHNRGIEYIYIGQQRGLVNTEKPLLNIDQLVSDNHFQVIYQQDRVIIFKFLGPEGIPNEN